MQLLGTIFSYTEDVNYIIITLFLMFFTFPTMTVQKTHKSIVSLMYINLFSALFKYILFIYQHICTRMFKVPSYLALAYLVALLLFFFSFF